MQTGTKISAAGHGALIVLAVAGLPWFGPRDRTPVQVTDVSFISAADFEAAQAAAPADAPRAEDAPAELPEARPAPPEPDETSAEPAQDAPPPVADTDTPAPPEEEVAVLAQPAEPDRIVPRIITLDPPTAAAPPRARPAPRIAPEPTPPPPEDLQPAEVPEPATAPDPEPTVAAPDRTPAAEPEAAPEPEAEPSPRVDLALETSGRPKPRQARPQPTPVRQAEADPEPEPTPDTSAEAVMALLQQRSAEAAATPATPPTTPTRTQPTAPTATSLPVGQSMTRAEKDGLRFAVQQCWNVPAGLRDAQDLTVTLGVELAPDGAVVNASIRLIDPATAPDARFQQAYEAGRRALIRCSPYADLPREKYAEWRNLEVVFNPKGMLSW